MEEIEKKSVKKNMTIPFEKKSGVSYCKRKKNRKKSNSLPHTDGHSASVNTISSSSVVMTKNQMNFEQFTI